MRRHSKSAIERRGTHDDLIAAAHVCGEGGGFQGHQAFDFSGFRLDFAGLKAGEEKFSSSPLWEMTHFMSLMACIIHLCLDTDVSSSQAGHPRSFRIGDRPYTSWRQWDKHSCVGSRTWETWRSCPAQLRESIEKRHTARAANGRRARAPGGGYHGSSLWGVPHRDRSLRDRVSLTSYTR